MKQGQWFPGSMAKAIKHLRQDLKIIDLVVELLDARIPISSRNPSFNDLFAGKQHLLLLHKADRADDLVTASWLAYFKEQGTQAMAFSVHSKHYLNDLLRYLKEQEHNLRPTRIKRPLRMMFVGIPNVGKSTLINYFVHKAVTKTANRPGITRGRQWIRITPGLELLDTPGVLWPKHKEETILPLALVAAMPSSVIESHDIAHWLLRFYLDQGKEAYLLKRYSGLCLDKPDKMLEQIAISQGCLLTAGKVDLDRAAAIILRDFQSGALGKVTLEKPADLDQENEE